MRAMPVWYEKYSIRHDRGLENASTAYTNFKKSIAAFTYVNGRPRMSALHISTLISPTSQMRFSPARDGPTPA